MALRSCRRLLFHFDEDVVTWRVFFGGGCGSLAAFAAYCHNVHEETHTKYSETTLQQSVELTYLTVGGAALGAFTMALYPLPLIALAAVTIAEKLPKTKRT